MPLRSRLAVLIGLLAVTVAAPLARAATVRFNIVPASNRNAQIRTIKTGSMIKYFIVVSVISDTSETDNSGLALFTVNVDTDLGVEQAPATEFVPVIRDNFRIFPSLGTPDDDNLIGVGASQNTFGGSVVTGLGQIQSQDLVKGFFQTPDVEGRFRVTIDLASAAANVLTANFAEVGGSSAAREITVGPGFIIDTADDAEEDPGDEFPLFEGLNGEAQLGIAAVGIGVVLLTVIFGMLVFGPWGAALGILLGSGLGLITLFTSSAAITGGG